MRKLLTLAAGISIFCLAAAPLRAQAGVGVTVSTVTILSAASLSGALYMGENVPVALLMPSSWTTASLTYQCSTDGTTYGNVYDDGGTEMTSTTAASRFVTLPAALFAGCKYIKIRSGTSGSPVTQGGDRVLTVVKRR